MKFRSPLNATLLVVALLFAQLSFSIPITASSLILHQDTPSDAEQSLFTRAQSLYNGARYDEAASIFKDLLKNYPKSSIRDLTLLWLGRSYLQLGQLQEAEQVGQRLRGIKDTPFVDIFESELKSARRNVSRDASVPAAAQPTPDRSAPLGSSTSTTVPTATKPTPEPTPQSAAQRNRTAAQPIESPTPRVLPTATPQVARTATPTPVPQPSRQPATSETPRGTGEGSQTSGLQITVRSSAAVNVTLKKSSESGTPGQNLQIVLNVSNSGNRDDRFRIETDLPAEFQPMFALAQSSSDLTLPILITPVVQRGSSIDVVLSARVPLNATDGQQRRFSVSATSESDSQVQRAASGSISIVASSLNASSTVSPSTINPGDTFKQTITVRNTGSGAVPNVRADFVFNPGFELVDASVIPSYDADSRVAVWKLGEIRAGETRTITATLRLTERALSTTGSVGRGIVQSPSMMSRVNFDSPPVSIARVSRVRLDAVSVGLTGKPGDVVYFPFVVRNRGNSPDTYEIKVSAPGAPAASVIGDLNGDGVQQENEPTVTQTSNLSPINGQFAFLLRVQAPTGASERAQFVYNVAVSSVSNARISSEASTALTVISPRVKVRTEQLGDASSPGDVVYYRLVLINEGSGMAKNLAVTESLPEALELVNTEPAVSERSRSGQQFVWKLAELAPGETAVLRVAVRLRSAAAGETNVTTRHSLTYQDTSGNNYHGQ